MDKTKIICAAALVAAACAYRPDAGAPSRGEQVGVNSYPAATPLDAKSTPVTGTTAAGISPSPSAMATTGASGSAVDTKSSTNAGMASSGSTSSGGSPAAAR